jgi:hypothetical protein
MMLARDDQIAAAIVRQLNDGVEKLDHDTAQRLAAARRTALVRAAAAPQPVLAPAPAAVSAIHAVGRRFFNWRYALPLAAILLCAGGMGYWHQRILAQPGRIAEIDTGLLTDDLPIGAYLDKDFTAWLKRSQR